MALVLVRYGFTLAAVGLVPGCFGSPHTAGDGVQVSSGEGASDGEPYDGGGEPGWSGSTASAASGAATTGAADSGGSATTLGADSGPGMTTAAADTGGDSASGGIVGEFPAPGVFGDDIRETDLVGSWTMPWNPDGVADVQFDVAADGTFIWTERAADCAVVGQASGVLWVESTQMVLHVLSWDKRLPWNPEPVIGETLARPFRMRLGYTTMGQYLGFAAPVGVTQIGDFAGHSYDRLDSSSGGAGQWAAEAELWALIVGQSEPKLVVRDRWSLSLATGISAAITHSRTWWWPPDGPGAEDDEVGAAAWSDDTPGNVAGAATIAGDLYAYDALHLFSFAADRSFHLGVVSDCN